MAIAHEVVANQGDAWQYTRETVSRFYERVASEEGGALPPEPPADTRPLTALVREPLPPEAHATSEAFLRSAELIGRRTAELHNALASNAESAAFAPETFTPLYQRSVYQSMRNLTQRSLRLLRRIPPGARPPRAGPGRARSSTPRTISSTGSTPFSNTGEPGSAPATTATSTSARCFTPGRTSSSSTSRESLPVRSATAGSSAHPPRRRRHAALVGPSGSASCLRGILREVGASR